jgi:hypothetical protein
MTSQNSAILKFKTYPSARFWINEGYYTIEQLDQMLAQMKIMKARQDQHLKQSMGISSQPKG